MRISNIKLKNNTILAPMAGINDIAFRMLCHINGAGLVSTEMVSTAALIRNNKATLEMLRIDEKERPVSVQLFGNKVKEIVDSVKLLNGKADIIDFNLGCPAHQVIQQGSGCMLMKKPEKVKEIITAIVKVSKVPVTVKMRSGINKKSINALKIAKLCEKAGASAVCIHPRTMEQGYSGKADWSIIKKVKQELKIPVIGNGDVTDVYSAERMLKETKCDAVMIGRAAMSNPFIFTQINEYLKNKKVLKTKKNFFPEYYQLWKKYNLNFLSLKQHAMDFTKGMQNAAAIRNNLSRCKTGKEIAEFMI